MLCPWECGVDRERTVGRCGVGALPVVGGTAVHMWEEPPISGTRGSGAVFFAGCNLGCVFCQNHEISRGCGGEGVKTEELCQAFWSLRERGVHNINLVTPSHVMGVGAAVRMAKGQGIGVPFVYNTNAYEKVEALRGMEGVMDVYLPDLKYFGSEPAERYSGAGNYFDVASKAILEMVRQVGGLEVDEEGIARRGVLIRHLVLPGLRRDSMRLLDWVARTVPDVPVSLLWQYVPTDRAGAYPELNRTVTTLEYRSVVDHFLGLGLKRGYMQGREAAREGYVPEFAGWTREDGAREGMGEHGAD